jgi:hypothetical protein
LLGAAIRFFSKGGHFNHASMVLNFPQYDDWGERRFTLDALEHGVILTPLSRMLEKYTGEVWWYPLCDEWAYKRNLIGQRALDLLGIEYDYPSLFANIVGPVSADAKRLFCSETVYLSYGYNGKVPVPADMPKLGIFKIAERIL